MASSFSRPGTLLGTITVVAFILTAVSSALTTYLAVALPTSQLSIRGISLAAAVIDLVGLSFLTIFILAGYTVAASRNHCTRTTTSLVVAILQILGLVLTLAMLSSGIKQHKQKPKVDITANLKGVVVGTLVLEPVTAIMQGVFFMLELASTRPSAQHETLHSRMHSSLDQYTDPSQKEAGQSTSPMALHNFAPSYGRGAVTSTSPITSPRSSMSKSSLRHSIQQVIRPVTSRSKLLKRSSLRDSKSVYSIPYSVETSPSDGFDMWDTSTVDQQDKETVLYSQGNGLETIPGSRPTSPAHALNGPFTTDESKNISPKADMVEASLPPSPTSERRQQRQRSITPRPSSTRSHTIRESRSSTPDESHIHPLFRSDSPAPPSATPGTVITASPQGGQTLTGEQMRVRSNGSRPSSRLAHSQSFDSSTGRDTLGSDPPPIPGFVLAEASFAGSEPRGRASSMSTARSRAVSMRSERTMGKAESLLREEREDGILVEE